jgi:hypothetical protein
MDSVFLVDNTSAVEYMRARAASIVVVAIFLYSTGFLLLIAFG